MGRSKEATECLSKIEVNNSKHGRGIFALKDLPADTPLCKITGFELSFNETVSLGKKECYCLQIEADKYLKPDYPFYFSNHSCDPNCGINENLELITIKDVSKGEELCWDYSTSMLERYWTMKCACGSECCRRIVTDFDILPEDIQNRYIEMKIVLPFILQAMIVNVDSNERVHKLYR